MIHFDQEQFGDAQQEIDQARVIARKTGAPAVEAEALYMQGELTRIQGKPRSALKHYQAAEVLSSSTGDPDLQSVRNRLQEKRFRAGYIQDKHQVYIELVRLQLELGRTTDAFSTAERLRTWSFGNWPSILFHGNC